MLLFINTFSHPGNIILFTYEREITDRLEWSSRHSEADTCLEMMSKILERNRSRIDHLEGIVAVVGPGSFTGARIVTLIVNTLAFAKQIPLYPISLGDFFDLSGADFPCVAPMTRRECLVWHDPSHLDLMMNDDIPAGDYTTCISDFDLGENSCMKTQIDYTRLIQFLDLSHPEKIIRPIYAKDPNITPRPHASSNHGSTT